MTELFTAEKLYRYRRNIIFTMNNDNIVVGIVTDDDNIFITYNEDDILVETRTIPQVLKGVPQDLIPFSSLDASRKLAILSSLENRRMDYGDTIIHDVDRIIIHAPQRGYTPQK